MYISQRDIGSITLPAATGGDGALTYSITPALPAGLTLTGNVLTGNVNTAPTGPTTYTYIVNDNDSNTTDTDTLPFTIEFLAQNGRFTPMFSSTASIPAQTYTEGADIGAVTLPRGYGGSDGVFVYSTTSALPNGLTLNGRILTGAPAAGTVQTATSYTYVVNDGDEFREANDFSTLPFTITIEVSPNQPPVITIPSDAAALVRAGDPVAFTVTGTDPDGDDGDLTFGVTASPTANVGAVFDTASGAFSWTPAATHVGVNTFTFRVH